MNWRIQYARGERVRLGDGDARVSSTDEVKSTADGKRRFCVGWMTALLFFNEPLTSGSRTGPVGLRFARLRLTERSVSGGLYLLFETAGGVAIDNHVADQAS